MVHMRQVPEVLLLQVESRLKLISSFGNIYLAYHWSLQRPLKIKLRKTKCLYWFSRKNRNLKLLPNVWCLCVHACVPVHGAMAF